MKHQSIAFEREQIAGGGGWNVRRWEMPVGGQAARRSGLSVLGCKS